MNSVLFAAVGVVLAASIGSAAAQSKITISEGIAARNGQPAQQNIPLENSGLYLVSVNCHPKVLRTDSRNNYYFPRDLFVNKSRQVAFSVTLSNAPIGINEVPPTASIIAAIPVVVGTMSKVAPVTTRNDTCSQSFLLTGRTSLYLTALYTDQISTAPSQLVKAVGAFAGLIAPLAPFFPAGPARLLSQDTTIANSMSQPYANLVGTLSYQGSHTITKMLEQGHYLVKTDMGYVTISVDRLASFRSAVRIRTIGVALDNAEHTLGQTVQTSIATNPFVCHQIGRTLKSTPKSDPLRCSTRVSSNYTLQCH